MTNYSFMIVVKLLVIFLIFVSPKEILAFYDTFDGYAEEPMGPSSPYEVFDVSKFGASPNANSDNTLVSLCLQTLFKYCNSLFNLSLRHII